MTYLRISIVGAPLLLLTLAGAGYLRGTQDTRTTLVIAVAANIVNLVLELVLVYGLDLGVAGSAWGTVLAQLGAAVAYVWVVGRGGAARRARSLRPDAAGIRANAVVGSRLVVRTGSLLLATLLAATAIAARFGDDDIAAHQIAMQVMLFLALVARRDRDRRAGDGRRSSSGPTPRTTPRASARRMIEWGRDRRDRCRDRGRAGVAVAGAHLHAPIREVQHLAEQVLWIVAAMQPVAAVVFVLDGVLIGAGDAGYLALAMLVATFAVFLPPRCSSYALDAGLLWLWAATRGVDRARASSAWWRASAPWHVTGGPANSAATRLQHVRAWSAGVRALPTRLARRIK